MQRCSFILVILSFVFTMSRFLFRLLFFFLLTSQSIKPTYAQNTLLINRLQNKLTTSKPAQQIGIYTRISWEFKNNQTDSALYYAKKALDLSISINATKHTASCINMLGSIYLSSGQEELAIQSFKEVMEMSKKHHLTLDLAHAYSNIGKYQHRLSNYDSALYYFYKADSLYSLKKGFRNKAISKINIGAIKYEIGDYGQALDHFLKAVEMYGYAKNKSQLGALFANIGNVYMKMGNINKALSYHKKAIETSKKQQDNRSLCASYRMIGNIYMELQNREKTKWYQQKSLELAKGLRDPYEYSSSLLEMGKASYYFDNVDSAYIYLKRSKQVLEESKNKDIEAQINFYLGNIQFDKGNETQALKFYQVALNKSKQIKANNITVDIYKRLAKFHRDQEELDTAIHYAFLYLQMKDSIFNKSVLDAIQTQEKYEAEKSEKESLRQEQLLAEQRQQKYLYMILGAIFLMTGMVLFFYFRAKRISLVKLLNVQERYNQQKILNLIKQHEIEAVKSRFEGQENERKRLAKELHDGIGGSLASLKLILSKNKGKEYLSILNKIDATYKEVRAVSRNLVPPALMNNAFTDLLEKYLRDVSKTHGLEVEFEFYPEKGINALNDKIKTDIYRIIQELVSNILKHSKASKIDSQLIMHDDYLNLMVADNGTGFGEIKNTLGIGLVNIKSRIASLAGNVEINSSTGNGTLINIDIPYKVQPNECSSS